MKFTVLRRLGEWLASLWGWDQRRKSRPERFDDSVAAREMLRPVTISNDIEKALKEVSIALLAPPRTPRSRLILEWGSLLVAVVGLTSIAISLFQLQQSTETATTENQRQRYQSVTEKLLDMDEALAQYPSLRPYFDSKASLDEKATDATRQQVMALAAQRVDYDEYIYNELLALDIAPETGEFVLRTPEGPANVNDSWLAWSEAIVADFRNSPAMCDIVRDPEAGPQYGAGFITALADQQVCPGLEGYRPVE